MNGPRAQELRLGTRGSQLAMWQARTVARRIAETGGPACELVVIRTSGDRLQEAPLSEAGGKRLFVKEIEDALLRRDIDLAVHSSKDMPAVLPDGLTIAGVLPREDPLDAVVFPASVASGAVSSVDDLVAALGPTPVIGTSSVRRIAQLTRLLPTARFAPVRGNLDTRLRKLDGGEHSALVLAAAGLRRLGFAARISFALPANACVPAPGQGIVAVEIRVGDAAAAEAVSRIDDPGASAALAAERALVEALGGGCQTPIGALASATGTGEPNWSRPWSPWTAAAPSARRLADRGATRSGWARRLGARLRADGADEILAEARRDGR